MTGSGGRAGALRQMDIANELIANKSLPPSAKGVKLSYYNKGSDSIKSDQIGVVGDSPNAEMVIGSKLNNGVAMNLSKGSGVVNAKSTNTLAGILNNLGNLGGGVASNISNSREVVNNYNITANVQDGKGLVDYLQNFGNQMTQKAFGYWYRFRGCDHIFMPSFSTYKGVNVIWIKMR